ncbi:MAG: histidine kinase dimerization/phospho-acceptor domain-containing protein [Gelidibacter sp.]|uniref:histidine kinase dimerization/phospho-acceptor domain-containing protein n=1 Tax=Gelidibacter sp. TaxID=2018083 RepID=UPI003265CED6
MENLIPASLIALEYSGQALDKIAIIKNNGKQAIIGFIELALRTQLDDTQRHYLEIINQSEEFLYSISNDILDFSKMKTIL